MCWDVTDLKDIIKIAIGAFIAFLFSIFVNLISKQYNVRTLKNKLMQEIKEHKKDIESGLEDTKIIIKFHSPIWDLLKSSSPLLYFNKKDYAKIVEIYIAMKQLEEYENSTEDLRESIVKHRNDLIKIIEKNMM